MPENLIGMDSVFQYISLNAFRKVFILSFNVHLCSHFCIIFCIRFSMEGTKRSLIKPGLLVMIVLKKDQRTGKLTEGVVKDILTNSPSHPHGIKVRLEDGQIGRVKEIVNNEKD